MKLERIIQMENESNEDFVRRVIDVVKKTDKQYELMFLNGKVLKTENYDLKEENFNINLIISDIEKQVTPNNKNEIDTEITQYIDFIEAILLKQRKEQEAKLEQKLQDLNKKLEQEKLRIEKLNTKLSKFAKNQTEIIKKLEDDKLSILDEKIVKIEEEIKASLDAIKIKEKEFQQENQLLEDYQSQLNQCKNAENPNIELIEELEEKIENQTKIVENYQEHLNYLKQENNKLNDDKTENLLKRKEIQKEAHKKLVEIKEEIESKLGRLNGSFLDMNNVPTIQELKSKISNTNIKLANLKQQVNFNKVRELISNKASAADIVTELNNLIAGYEQEKIENELGLKISIENREKEIRKKKNRLNQIQEKLSSRNNYLNQDEIEKDQQEKKEIENFNEELEQEITLLEEQLDNLETIPHLKSKLKTFKRSREFLENKLENAVLDDEIEIIENYQRRIEKLKSKEEAINEKIENLKGTLSAKTLLTKALIDRKLKKLREQKRINHKNKRMINNKTNEDYLDEETLLKDETELNMLNTELEELKNTKNEVQIVTMAELVSETAAKYMEISNKFEDDQEEIELEEPIERYEDAPKSLIEKIKTIPFIKKATKAIAGIVASVVIISGISIVTDNDKSNIEVITEEENKDEKEDIISEVEEKTNIEESTIEESVRKAQDQTLEEIIADGKEADVYQDVFSAASNVNEKRVGINTSSWESATPGAIYAVKDKEKVKINLQDAENYINEGYDIVSAYVNDGEIIGFDQIDLTPGLGSTERTK